MRRKKDTGEPGNRGEFASSSRQPSGLELDPLEPGGVGAAEDAAGDVHVTVATLNDMLRPAQPVAVRAAAARSYLPGTSERASYDPNPYVRALAWAGWDLSERARARLNRDPQVRRVLSAIAS